MVDADPYQQFLDAPERLQLSFVRSLQRTEAAALAKHLRYLAETGYEIVRAMLDSDAAKMELSNRVRQYHRDFSRSIQSNDLENLIREI